MCRFLTLVSIAALTSVAAAQANPFPQIPEAELEKANIQLQQKVDSGEVQIAQALDIAPEEPQATTPEPQVFVHVDKSSQTITIQAPGMPILEDSVSTGGGFKNPKGSAKRPNPKPYCAHTTNASNLWIPARIEGKSKNPTMYRTYYSNLFTDERTGEQVPMPDAIYIQNGEFFHAYKGGSLGTPKSGGCVRLRPSTARTLFNVMAKHGGILVTIYGDDGISKAARAKCEAKVKYTLAQRGDARSRESTYEDSQREAAWSDGWGFYEERPRLKRKSRKFRREEFNNPFGPGW